MIKAVVFDFDQVVIKSYADHHAAFLQTAKKFGIKLDSQELYKRFGKSAKNIIAELVPSMSAVGVKKFVVEKEKSYQRIVAKKGFTLMPGIKNVLSFLSKKKIKCAISSSASRKNILLAIKKTKMRKYFSAIVATEDVKKHKPHPEPLFRAAKILHLKPSECIYVGDSIFEMKAAKRAGMLAVGIHTGIYSERELEREGAKKVIHNILELKKFLK